ncbi:MAG TPA: hypothetical protein VGA70_14270 [Longimicrobiales bacterium]
MAENREAEFIARITASATHELRNVLAIVEESAGPLDDLIHASAPGAAPDRERLLRATKRITTQVARGTELLTRLSGLAHCRDRPQASGDLRYAVDQAVYFSGPIARRRRQSVAADTGEEPVCADVDPLRLQMALLGVTECCVERLPEEATLRLRPYRLGAGAGVAVSAEKEGAALATSLRGAAGWERLSEALEALGAAWDEDDPGSGTGGADEAGRIGCLRLGEVHHR